MTLSSRSAWENAARCSAVQGMNVKKLALSLEKKGFVHIETNPDRPRALMILLTDKADACFDGAFAPYREQLGELFTGLNEDQTLALFEDASQPVKRGRSSGKSRNEST